MTSTLTDIWVKGSWDEYLEAIAIGDTQEARVQTCQTKIKSYYYQGRYKLEMSPLGFDHGCDHYIIILAVSFYAVYNQIAFRGIDNCSYRKTGSKEAQPDISYYIGTLADIIPHDTSIVDLAKYPPPNLVIEIAKSTLSEDLGNKRLLYEELGVREYWVVDVQNAEVIAFEVKDGGSRRLKESLVLAGLAISVLNEALQRTRQSNHGVVSQWLIERFQQGC